MEYACPECENDMFFIERDITGGISFRCTNCANEITHGPGLTVRQVVEIMDRTTTNIDKKENNL